ncbi:MAG TPA: hypothetical protein GXX14_06225 [Clostridiaceae bacterium]|nr:hypothetical protein [Clostridiaceae bacterium]
MKICGDLIDILWTWDDVAMQTGMIFPREMWQKFFKNRLRKICDLAKKYNLKMMYHCCGSPIEILPDLIEIGVDILSPIQTSAKGMDPKKLKKEYGKDLCFHGGIDTQQLLPFGTEEQVRDAVRYNIEALGPRYIVASSHVLNDCIPVNNVIAMFDEAINYKL